MEQSVGTTIELIKLQEQEKEAKLKEKREFETTLATLHRATREALQQTEKYKQEENDLIKRTDHLRMQLELERIRRNALRAQIDSCQQQLEELRAKSDEGVSKVWDFRSSLCETVQNVSDECDVWALLMRPMCTEPLPRPNKKVDIKPKLVNEARLKNAKERREKAVAERERLIAEPDLGDEFIRIKNALRYSLEMIANLQK